uniref:Uncharacterized protein n=1 Tax=Oryza meridionalis TaxID=40149 RepID=A0A0E0CK14_9ORYZ
MAAAATAVVPTGVGAAPSYLLVEGDSAAAVCGGGGSGDGGRDCGGGSEVGGDERVGCEARMATARWLGVLAAAAAEVVTVSAVTRGMAASDG